MASHLTLDQAIAGSSPASSAKNQKRLRSSRVDEPEAAPDRPHRLVVRTPASHVGNAGSTPAGVTNEIKGFLAIFGVQVAFDSHGLWTRRGLVSRWTSQRDRGADR